MDKINQEIALGRIAGPFPAPPFPNLKCSPLALREKSTKGKYRLLHNLSFPYNDLSVNRNIPDSAAKVAYSTLSDAFKIITSFGHCYLSKTDISDAFRLIPLHPSQYPLTGFKVQGNFYYDRTLPMGARSACQIFEKVSDALLWILKTRYGISNVVKVLDDFLFIENSREQCLHALQSFKEICQLTGFPLAEHKTVPPTTSLTFLGLSIDTTSQEASLPQDKVNAYSCAAEALLTLSHCSLRQLKSVIGQLQFACSVIPSGRCFLRRLHNLTSHKNNPNSLIPIPPWAKEDLSLWISFLSRFNGRALYNFAWLGDSSSTHFYSDSSKTGYGGTFFSHYIQGTFPPSWQQLNITFLELYPIFLLVKIFAHTIPNSHLLFHCDNEAVVHILNNKTSKDKLIMTLVRPLVLCLMSHNIIFRARHIPGLYNIVPDFLSRSQATPQFLRSNGLDPLPTPVPASLRPTNLRISLDP